MKLLVVGEYLSQRDEGKPFNDGLGKMLKAFLREKGIEPRECHFTNVINKTPPGRQSMFGFCGPKTEGIRGVKYLKRGHYVRAEYKSDLEALWKLVNDLRPNLVLACGDMPLWALTSENTLKYSRGRITNGHSAIPEQKILPVNSTRQLMADWSLRPILLADLEKARRQMEFPEIIRPERFIHLEPSLEDLETFYQDYIAPSPKLDVDIETKNPLITCIGLAPSPERAIVVPFFCESNPSGNYWKTQREEYLAWRWVARMLSLPKKICGQNFQYDIQYLWKYMGITVPSFSDDTMHMHHSLQPEMQKGLGFLASVYTDELPWKFMHIKVASDKSSKKGDTE